MRLVYIRTCMYITGVAACRASKSTHIHQIPLPLGVAPATRSPDYVDSFTITARRATHHAAPHPPRRRRDPGSTGRPIFRLAGCRGDSSVDSGGFPEEVKA